MLYTLLKKVLFLFSPETAHHIGAFGIRFLSLFKLFQRGETYSVGPHTLRSPVGMAAGFDKEGDLAGFLHHFGFGFVESGTFTLYPQEGNPKPRVFRFPEHRALFNRMGFNNPGIEKGLENLSRKLPEIPVGISIGKMKNTSAEDAPDEYIKMIELIQGSRYRLLQPHVAYIAINISSPNTPGLRDLQEKGKLQDLLIRCKKHSLFPVYAKFAPDFQSMEQFKDTLRTALKSGVDGVILTNTTTDRTLLDGVVPEGIYSGGGGLSGAPLAERSFNYLQSACSEIKRLKRKVVLVSVGGIFTAEDIKKRMEAGADLVQIYSSFIYNGPWFLSGVNRKMKEFYRDRLGSLRSF